jgi:predicted DNA-binding transcriptional regulator YafY
VVSYPGNSGGFGILESFRLDRQVLTLSDMKSMLSALRGINTTLESRELDSAIEKISSLVPANRSAELTRYFDRFFVDVLPWGADERMKDRVKTVHLGVAHEQILSFAYRSSRGETVRRRVEPMTLALKGYTWYLYAYCRLREDFRVFRLSRMRDVELCDERFARREGSFQEYYRKYVEGEGSADIDILLRFQERVRFLVEDYFDEADVTEEPGGTVLVSTALPGGEWLTSMLLSYGPTVEVLEPQWLKNAVRNAAAEVVQIYESSRTPGRRSTVPTARTRRVSCSRGSRYRPE